MKISTAMRIVNFTIQIQALMAVIIGQVKTLIINNISLLHQIKKIDHFSMVLTMNLSLFGNEN